MKPIDESASNHQQVRTGNLKKMLTLSTIEGSFRMEQETPFNVYYEKLQAQKIKNCQIQSNEDNLERGVNTDEIETLSLIHI